MKYFLLKLDWLFQAVVILGQLRWQSVRLVKLLINTKSKWKTLFFYKSFINLNFLCFILPYFQVNFSPVYKLPKLNFKAWLKGGLELGAKGMAYNLRRSDNAKVDLDFVAERVGSG